MERIWLWLKQKTIAKALEALLKAGDDEHEKARHSSGALANEHRAEAEEFHAAKADLWAAQHKHEQPLMNHGSIVSAPHSSGASAAVHEGNIKILPWLILTAMLSGFAIALSCAAIGAAWIMYTKFHVLTVTVDNHDALMLREGIKQPGDVAKGPNGNLEFKRKE